MQQTDGRSPLAVAIRFAPFINRLHDDPLEERDITVIHRRKCKVAKRGYCSCRPVLIHVPITD